MTVSVIPRRLSRHRPVHWRSLEGGALVREEDACALVADVMMLRAARGHDVTVTPENTVWLIRSAVLMLGAFGAGSERKEESDG